MRRCLKSDLNLFVAPPGYPGASDSNNGLTPATPWASLNYAVAQVSTEYDPCGFKINVHLVPDATRKHSSVTLRNYLDAGCVAQQTNPRIVGDVANPSLYQIEGIVGVGVTTPWIVEGVKLTSAGGYGVLMDFHSKLYMIAPEFGVCGVDVCALFGSSVELLGCAGHPTMTISGACAASLMANFGSSIICQGGAVTFTNTPSFTSAFAMCQRNSSIYFAGVCSGTNNAAKTYICEMQSGIDGAPAMPSGAAASSPDATSYAQ